MIYQLDEDLIFPDPTEAEDDGLLAVGGDLSVERLLLAYRNGIFPWYGANTPILWWCPKERYVIFPEKIHISHSMKKYIKKHDIKISLNGDFKGTIHKCREMRETTGTWITDDMEKAYCRLYEKGFAMSLEAYVDDELAGGLYGVVLGKCFFGESMYSVKENGSKLALIGLANYMIENNGLMIDCQMHTSHLESMGGEKISYVEYMTIVQKGLCGKEE